MNSAGLPTASATPNSTAPTAATTAAQMPPGLQPPAADAPPALSMADVAQALRDINQQLAELRAAQHPPPPPPMAAAPTLPPPSPVVSHVQPLGQVKWPPSPSPLPSWVDTPVFTPAPSQPTTFRPAVPSFGGPGGVIAPYTGGSSLVPDRHEGTYALAPQGPQPSRFTKMEFATYDGSLDPLNWLNQCDQFFRGQRTLSADRTWIASYHLRGAAQTWYYALEQDEGGMPPWERFRDLCLQRFGPTLRGSRLAELGRLAFTTTVQDFADQIGRASCRERV